MGWAGEGTAVEPTCAKNKLRPHQLKKQKKNHFISAITLWTNCDSQWEMGL